MVQRVMGHGAMSSIFRARKHLSGIDRSIIKPFGSVAQQQ